jgi:thioredoxin 1
LRKTILTTTLFSVIAALIFMVAGSDISWAQSAPQKPTNITKQMPNSVAAINAQTDDFAKYNAALNQKKPMIVDFYTDWCGWCKKLEPVLADLKTTWRDKVVFVRINAEDPKNKDIVKKANVKGFPTMHFYTKDGKLEQVIPGFAPKERIEQQLKKIAP